MGWFEFICMYLSRVGASPLHSVLVGWFHKPEFALKSNTFAFIFFCLADRERKMGGLYLNKMWSLPSCKSNSEDLE